MQLEGISVRNLRKWLRTIVLKKLLETHSIHKCQRNQMMLSKSVSRTLFRSLLRWNRRPEVVASKFGLDTSHLSIDKFMPTDFKIIGNEHVQASIYHIFRNNEPTDDNLDLCFAALRDLNDLSSQLKERIALRAKYSSDEFNSKVVFRIGQPVKYKKLKFRGVVVGWEIDPVTKKQNIEVLFDVHDFR